MVCFRNGGNKGMNGHYVDTDWRGRPIQAWLPDHLKSQAFEVNATIARHTEQAIAAVLRANELTSGQLRYLAGLLLRNEGIASSFIEGIEAPTEDVVAAGLGAAPSPSSASVSDNLVAVREALATANQPLQVSSLHSWHRRLMSHGSQLPDDLIGAFRDRQGWVGGDIPTRATFVPPPAEDVEPLMTDLVEFANREDLDAITQAAVVHAQFEIIHPYGDGNGRLGRLLIAWVLAQRLNIDVPPPVSMFMARDIGGYRSGLMRVGTGPTDEWVDWMAIVVKRSAEACIDMTHGVAKVRSHWQAAMHGLHSDATARRLADLLLESPVLASDIAARQLGVGERAARLAFHQLEQRGVVSPSKSLPAAGPGRPRQWWSAGDLLSLIESWGARPQAPELDITSDFPRLVPPVAEYPEVDSIGIS